MPNTFKRSEGNEVKREEQSMVSTTAYVYRISKFFQEEGENQTISSGNEATKKLLEKLKVENPGKGVFLFKGIADGSERENAMKAYNAFGKWYQNASVEDRKKALAAIAYYNSLHSSDGTLSFYTRKKILKAMENSMDKVGSFDINKFYSNLGLTELNGSLSNEVQLFMKQYDEFLNEKLNNVKQDLLLNEEEQTKPNEPASENPLKDQALEKVNEPLEESKETPLNVREIRKRNVKKEIFGNNNKEFKSKSIEDSFNFLFDKSKDIKITRDLMKMFVESDEMKKMTKKFAEFKDDELKNQEFKIHILGEGPFNREESKIVTGEEYKHALDRLLEIANQNESLFSEKLEDGKLWDHVMEPILAFDEEKIKKGDSKTLMKGLESSVIVSKLNGNNKLIKKYEDLFKAYSREGRVDYTALERAIKQIKGNYSNIDINNAERFMDEVIKAKSSQFEEQQHAKSPSGNPDKTKKKEKQKQKSKQQEGTPIIQSLDELITDEKLKNTEKYKCLNTYINSLKEENKKTALQKLAQIKNVESKLRDLTELKRPRILLDDNILDVLEDNKRINAGEAIFNALVNESNQ